jgi:O-antigen/teichoic acid export membrane protein
MTGAKFVAYFMSQADVLIGAKLLGKEALGLYTVSLQLASLPVDKAMSTVNQVAFSAISRMQDQRHEMQQALLKAIRLLAYLMLPLIYGLASVAPEFIPIALGPNWGGAVLPLQIVAVVIPLRMITAFYATAIYGVGRADLGFKNTLVGAAILPLCFYVGAQWGAVGLAAGWLVGTPTVFLFNFRRSRDALGISFRQLFGALAKPFLSALCMVLALMVIRSALSETLQPWITLLLLIGVGAIAYGLAAFALDSQLRKEVIAIPQIQRLIKGF